MARKRYQNFVQDLSGNALSGATISVFATGTVTPLVTLYIDSGATQTTLANPVSSDANGNFWFYSEDGIYDLKIEHPSSSSAMWMYGIEQIAFTETEKIDNKNVANGYCGLGANGKVQTAQLPVDGYIPPGTIAMFGGASAPTGWVLCDGTYYAYNHASYSALYAVIGYTYGQSSTNFRVPYFNGRSPLGAGTGSGLSNRVMGQTLGDEYVTLIASQLPAHSHIYYATSTSEKTWMGTGYVRVQGDYTSHWTSEQETRGGNHYNMHPCLVVNFIIKL